jgi:rhodanese-related sulfurtransferase
MMKNNKLIIMLILCILVIICYLGYMYHFNSSYNTLSLKISIPEAKARRFGLIIDVRTPKERKLLGYYPNSIPISMENLRKQVPLDISSKKTWILVYSNGDSRAEMAAKILYRMGYTNVRYITQTYLSLMPGSS